MHVLSVSDLTSYLHELLEADDLLQDLWLEGEVSNVSHPASGHWYWTLKEGDSQVSAVCFRQQAVRLSTLPEHGARVLAHGQIRFWEGNGKLQLYVDFLRPAGIGLLNARFEELRERLRAEGLFEPSRKRPLPAMPRRIGVVTSPTGAAFRDICTVLRRRCPLVELVLAPSLVQGEGAPEALVEALYSLYELDVDVILLARGGGSMEDLWAFNEEIVARAMLASPVPIVTGVGHETDTTIVDYIADLRAPTPSVAAELVTPDIALLRDAVVALRQQLAATMQLELGERRSAVLDERRRLEILSPQGQLRHSRQAIAGLRARLAAQSQAQLALQRSRLHGLTQQLQALSPAATMARGYAIVTRTRDGALVSSAQAVHPGDRLRIHVQDGNISATTLAAQKEDV